MRKGIKKIAKIGLIVVLVILALPALSLLFLQNRQVQTQLAKYMAERLSEELQANISLSSVNYTFFRRVQVRDLYIEDLHGDTLLFAELTKLRIKQFRPDPPGLNIRKATLENALVNLVIDSNRVVNIRHFTDPLKNPHNPPELKPRVHFESIKLLDSRFSLSRMGSAHGKNPIDFNDFHLRDVNTEVHNLEVFQDTVRMEVDGLSCRELSGLVVEEINTRLSINKGFLHFDELEVRTGDSDLRVPRLWFDFDSYRDFRHFSSLVDLQFQSRQSRIKMHDLMQFAPVPGRMVDVLLVDGDIHGNLANLQGEDLLLTFPERSTLAFDFMMIGLPEIKNTFLDFKFRELNTSVESIYGLMENMGRTAAKPDYPWLNLGNIDFRGRFTGYPDQFVASGLLETEMGRALLDLSFDPDSLSGISFQGHLSTRDFQMGTFLGQEENLGHLDMNVFTSGKLQEGKINARLEGSIDTLQLYSYAYSNITLDGSFTNNTFEGGFSISDPNIQLDFEGRTDFSGDIPVHRFTADVGRLRPYYLNLLKTDPKTFMSFLIRTDLSGGSIDELNGEIKLVNSLFEKSDAQLQLYDANLTMRNTPDASLIRFRSEVLDADITGKYRLSNLPASFENLADYFVDVVPDREAYVDTSNFLIFKADLKRMNHVLNYFYPTLNIGDRSQLSGQYLPLERKLEMSGRFSDLKYRGLNWHQVNAEIDSDTVLFNARIRSDSLVMAQSYVLMNQEFNFLAANDTAYLGTSWFNNSLPAFEGNLEMHAALRQDSIDELAFRVQLDSGEVVIRNELWKLSRATMDYSEENISLDNFTFSSKDKLIRAQGNISQNEKQDFQVEVLNLNLAALPGVLDSPLELEGLLSGRINYQKDENIPLILTNLEVDTLSFNRHLLGPSRIEARWNEAGGHVDMLMLSELGGERLVETGGSYTPSSGELDFEIRLRNFALQALNQYTRGFARDLDGFMDVALTLDGKLSEPELNGSITFDEGQATISALNAGYAFSDQLRIYRNNLYFEDFAIRDLNGNPGRINGSVANTYLKDFFFNLTIDAQNIQCMNTSSADNQVFYGTIFGSGNVTINGSPEKVKLNITASTENNTALFLPLYNASEVSSHDFITFISEELEEKPPEEILVSGGSNLELDIKVNVTDRAVVQLIFDPKVGDIIETRGAGRLRILLTENNGFQIFGDVELTQGDYLFTLQNVINKRFNIEPGGSISFNGNPMDASIDLEAVYTLRAAPYNLYPDKDENRDKLAKRIPVDCQLVLQGELGAPTISTGISMPTADAETRSLLINATSTDEELMRQFLSLLVINNFYSVTGYDTGDIGATGNIAGVTASELLSNQLSNWLSQISDDFDIGINYRPGDDVTQDEVEVALSTQMLNDRIIISGNVDVGGQEANPPEGSNNPYVMGDFDVEFRVTDNISIFAFNRARDELLYETAPYKQGVGISFREEFDSFSQLLARYREGAAKRKKKRKKARESDSQE